MYKGKRVMDDTPRKRPALLMASLVALLTVSVVGTVAFLVTSAGPVENTFTPAEVPNEVVEDITTEPGVKNNVRIHNTGNADAYVRAAVVFNWVDAEGNIYGGAVPKENTDYEITWSGLDDQTWKKGEDGYYYYTKVVKADDGVDGGPDLTSVLFTGCSAVTKLEGYNLSVEIMGQTIQADGQNSEGKTPVELAWGEAAAKLVGAIEKEG